MKLLNIDQNAKTVKGQKKGYMTAILYLVPFKLSGYQVCPMAEVAGCVGDCLNTAGRGGMAKADADTVTVGKIDELFDLLDDADVVIPDFCGWLSSGNKISNRIKTFKGVVSDEML